MSKHTAQARALVRAGFYIAVAAFAEHHLGFARFDYPVSVLLELLRRPLEFGDMQSGFVGLIFSFHTFYAPMNAAATLR